MSCFITTLVVISMACMASFLFYQVMEKGSLGTQILITSPVNKFQLRSSNRDNRPKEVVPPVQDLDQDPSIGFGMPDCAQDVFLTLHKELGGANEHACKGLLIRDDIIITSHECSKFNFTFDFAGFGIVQAVPHISLNSKEEMVNSQLGFLEARSPYHYHVIDHPVRRTRMFLSHRSNPIANGKDIVMSCAAKHKPIAHNFPVDGDMVPVGQLANVLQEHEILWDYMHINEAIMLKYKTHRWWTLPITLEEEDDSIKEMFEKYQGPPGSISIPDAHESFISEASNFFEVVDPRGHRRPDCFNIYYEHYREEEPFSGLHFFDWLDFGPGKFLLENSVSLDIQTEHDMACHKKNFNRQRGHYFSDKERLAHEIYIEPSKSGTKLIARYKHNNHIVPSSTMLNPHLYMWDLNENFFIVDDTWNSEKYGRITHSRVVSGQPALSAGKAYFGKDGAIWGINFSSGHYRPHIQAASMMYQWFKNQGFNVQSLYWVGRISWSTDDCRETDWESIKIPGFNADALNQSCHEMTSSPAWILKDDI